MSLNKGSNSGDIKNDAKGLSASPDKVAKNIKDELENTKKALQSEKSLALKLQLELNKALQSKPLVIINISILIILES